MLPKLFSIACLLLPLASTMATPIKTQSNVPAEVVFHATGKHADPFNEVTMDVVFSDPDGVPYRVPAFWDGGNVWKARYASSHLGEHTYKTICAEDPGLNGLRGTIQVTGYRGKNPLYKHGPIQAAPDKRYLQHSDGTPFLWLADTWWMGLAKRLQWPEEFKALTADRVQKGFNVVQIVAGLYPDMFPYDQRGANEAGFPWEPDYKTINPAYFDKSDERLAYLVDQGISPCIVGAWGYFMGWMGVEKLQKHWRYLIARYGAYPVVWCGAGEANLPWYLAPGFAYDDREAVHKWTEVLRFIRQTDPYHRLLTIHPTAINAYTARHATDDADLLDWDMLQTPHGEEGAAEVALKAMRDSYAAQPQMPVIDGEAAYEMLSDSLPTRWTRAMFWICMTNGAAGHTYGANGIWQNNRPGDPHGKSPHGGTYGKISSQEAMHLPGSAQEAMGKRLFEKYPWQKFQPHPDWAVYEAAKHASLDGSRWIWYPEGNPMEDAPIAARFFRARFELPEKAIASARLVLTADDEAVAYLNGARVGESKNWRVGIVANDLVKRLHAGANVLAVKAENQKADVAKNPAGLIALLEVVFQDGTSQVVRSDRSWKASQTQASNWEKPEFDDASWPSSMDMAAFGAQPWGHVGLDDSAIGPQSTGISGGVRIIYMLQPRSVVVRLLGSNTSFAAKLFDPVTGETKFLGKFQADSSGNWSCSPPPGWDHDWVLMIEPAARGPGGTGHTFHAMSSPEAEVDLDWTDNPVQTVSITNELTGRQFPMSGGSELGLTFSAATDHIAEPLQHLTDFQVGMRMAIPYGTVIELFSSDASLEIRVHYDFPIGQRRKWVEIKNVGKAPRLLLDVDLDNFVTDGAITGGGQGQPLYIDGEMYAAVEHPAGVNSAEGGRVKLTQHPGKVIKPGETFTTYTSVVGFAPHDKAHEQFLAYIQAKSLRPKRDIAVYTTFGINNQWGAAPSLDDGEVLDVLGLLKDWQKKEVKFDYFTLDTGWVDPDSDLKRFRPGAFPNGPAAIVNEVNREKMNLGLWFAMEWATQANWQYPGAYAGGTSATLPYKEGYPLTAGGITFCLGTSRYYDLLKAAVLYHVKSNHVRFLKFDGGLEECSDPSHDHLPGIYSLELKYDRLIDIAESARNIDPSVFVMWYWGLRSPFWALYGDTIFDSGYHLEGSGTSSTPTLFYRDSVTLAQDQAAQFSPNIPPVVKDSLGVWIAENRWGNFMGKERWREAAVMDLGRGNLLFPNLWGNLYSFDKDDVSFLARMQAMAKENAALLATPRHIIGNVWGDSAYGYAYFKGTDGLIFLSNPHFDARAVVLPFDSSLGLVGRRGGELDIFSIFPSMERLSDYKIGENAVIWLRPFETLILQVADIPFYGAILVRPNEASKYQELSHRLALKPAAPVARLDVRFADSDRFAAGGLHPAVQTFEAVLPKLSGPQPILAVVIRLQRRGVEWKVTPKPVEVIQTVAVVDGHMIQLVPMPDGRQFGNTQHDGSSWIVYKIRLSPKWAGKKLTFAVHTWLPADVNAEVEGWVVKQWWQQGHRPQADGYYTDAAS